MFHLKIFGWRSILPILIAGLLPLAAPANSEEPDTTNWVQKGGGLQCTAFGVRADETLSDPLNPVWRGDGVSGTLPTPIFKHIKESENGLNVVAFEKFAFNGDESSLAFEVEVFSQREELILTAKHTSFHMGKIETLEIDQLIIKKFDFLTGSKHVLQFAIDEKWVPQYYERFKSYTIECKLNWLENN